MRIQWTSKNKLLLLILFYMSNFIERLDYKINLNFFYPFTYLFLHFDKLSQHMFINIKLSTIYIILVIFYKKKVYDV